MAEAQHYCPYPFAQVTTTPTGSFKLCCSSSEAHGVVSDFGGVFEYSIKDTSIEEYWKSPYLRWVRGQHEKNLSIKECDACFKYERNGSESYRQRALRELGFFSKPLAYPKSLDLKLGNKCNASCLFCDPSSSSRVFNEWKMIGWDKKPPFETGLTGPVGPELFQVDYNWAEDPGFWSQLVELSGHLTNLKFTGGEPLINSHMIRFLRMLVKQGRSKNIRLQVTTNGIVVPESFLDITHQFKEVEINFSVDGYGRQNEYIRFPTRWRPWVKNVERVSGQVGSHVKLHFQHSISMYSVFGLREYFLWMWPYKKFGFHMFQVFHPEMQQPDVLSFHEKRQVGSDLEELIRELGTRVECDRDEYLLKEMQGIVNLLYRAEDKSHLKPRLREYVQILDRHRKISMGDCIPKAAASLGL